jgi:hypothetical protein
MVSSTNLRVNLSPLHSFRTQFSTNPLHLVDFKRVLVVFIVSHLLKDVLQQAPLEDGDDVKAQVCLLLV